VTPRWLQKSKRIAMAIYLLPDMLVLKKAVAEECISFNNGERK